MAKVINDIIAEKRKSVILRPRNQHQPFSQNSSGQYTPGSTSSSPPPLPSFGSTPAGSPFNNSNPLQQSQQSHENSTLDNSISFGRPAGIQSQQSSMLESTGGYNVSSVLPSPQSNFLRGGSSMSPSASPMQGGVQPRQGATPPYQPPPPMYSPFANPPPKAPEGNMNQFVLPPPPPAQQMPQHQCQQSPGQVQTFQQWQQQNRSQGYQAPQPQPPIWQPPQQVSPSSQWQPQPHTQPQQWQPTQQQWQPQPQQYQPQQPAQGPTQPSNTRYQVPLPDPNDPSTTRLVTLTEEQLWQLTAQLAERRQVGQAPQQHQQPQPQPQQFFQPPPPQSYSQGHA